MLKKSSKVKKQEGVDIPSFEEYFGRENQFHRKELRGLPKGAFGILSRSKQSGMIPPYETQVPLLSRERLEGIRQSLIFKRIQDLKKENYVLFSSAFSLYQKSSLLGSAITAEKRKFLTLQNGVKRLKSELGVFATLTAYDENELVQAIKDEKETLAKTEKDLKEMDLENKRLDEQLANEEKTIDLLKKRIKLLKIQKQRMQRSRSLLYFSFVGATQNEELSGEISDLKEEEEEEEEPLHDTFKELRKLKKMKMLAIQQQQLKRTKSLNLHSLALREQREMEGMSSISGPKSNTLPSDTTPTDDNNNNSEESLESEKDLND